MKAAGNNIILSHIHTSSHAHICPVIINTLLKLIQIYKIFHHKLSSSRARQASESARKKKEAIIKLSELFVTLLKSFIIKMDVKDGYGRSLDGLVN